MPALLIEDAIPISVSSGQTKSAKEVFQINSKKLREKSELSKEERRKARAQKKRVIKSSLKKREVKKKEEKRQMGVAMNDRFERKQVTKTEKEKKNTMKSAKFFSNLQQVV